ncbi:putative oxidoreductase C terminal-domain-containing protein [Gaertneriomyces semiglobifer]|nr:putative oxidoreductase C terminal-domain-containing protein [Gaertneriomyces semiglobifer]
MCKMPGLTATTTLKVAFVGAGGIHFGTPDGPWNHSVRLEKVLGADLNVTAIIDPSPARRAEVLAEKRSQPVAPSYQYTQEFDTVPRYLEAIQSDPSTPVPDIVLIGIPPAFHGSLQPGKDIELQFRRVCGPRTALFVEKPMSSSPADEVLEIGRRFQQQGGIVSVGYFMRYLKAVTKIKELIVANNLTVMTTIARYSCTYESIKKMDWWMKSISCSPIVEQGTHFVDLSCFFGGEVDMSSVQAHAVEWYEPPGKLSVTPVDEESIAPDDRVPRVTSSVFKYKSGAVGTMVHTINLQGHTYSCELEVHCDGWMFRLVSPYDNPRVYVRSPASDAEVLYTFPEDDPYLTQMECLVDAVRSCNPEAVLCPWDDAARTYELTWAIRYASEKWGKERLLKEGKAMKSALAPTPHESPAAINC